MTAAITARLHEAGWIVNVKRVERIWRREGLKVPHKQPKRGRLWLNNSSCLRGRPERPNHVWSYDFVEDRTHNGRKIHMLNVIDAFTRECIAITVERGLHAVNAIDELRNGEIVYTLKEAKIVVENWRHHDNTLRPHPSLS